MLDLLTSTENPAMTVVYLFAFLAVLLVALPLHEYAHAKVAALLGDDTPEKSGRLTLNPFAHIDVMGIIALLMVGIGWAKPVPVSPGHCKKAKPKPAMLLISLAGPLTNLLLAYIGTVIYQYIYFSNYELLLSGKECFQLYIFYAAMYFASMNVSLTVFNLMPIPPFDGSRIFLAFLPTKLYFKIMKYERVIMGVMFLLLLFGVFSIPLSYLNYWLRSALEYGAGFVRFLV